MVYEGKKSRFKGSYLKLEIEFEKYVMEIIYFVEPDVDRFVIQFKDAVFNCIL